MSYTRHIIFSALCIFNISLSIEPMVPNNNPDAPLCTPATPTTIRETIDDEQTDTEPNIFTEEDIEEMKSIFESSPRKAQVIIKHLQDPAFFPQSEAYRSTYFIGEPGSDKTAMANIIAYGMSKSGWTCKTISSTSILKEHPDKLSIILHEKLKCIEESNSPTIVIIEDLDQLLTTSHSKYHDIDAASKTLWTFLDKQKGNKNFFLIATMNNPAYLPDSFKDRMLLNYITFPLISYAGTKTNILRKYLITPATPIHPEVTNDFLNQQLGQIGPCSRSNLKKLSAQIVMINKIIEVESSPVEKTEETPLSMIHKMAITAAIDEYIINKKELGYKIDKAFF